MQKRQRTDEANAMQLDPNEQSQTQTMRRISRARSDSAPLGYGMSAAPSIGVSHGWEPAGRPRSGSTRHGPRPPSAIAQAHSHQPRMEYAMPGMVGVQQLMPGVGLGINGLQSPQQPIQTGMIVHSQGVKDEPMRVM
jgi:hypothetical protein